MSIVPFRQGKVLLVEEAKAHIQAEFQEKSTRALRNMYSYCQERVEQLGFHRGDLKFIAEDEGEIQELVRLAERMDRVERNYRRFAEKRKRVELEIIRRALRERTCTVDDAG